MKKILILFIAFALIGLVVLVGYTKTRPHILGKIDAPAGDQVEVDYDFKFLEIEKKAGKDFKFKSNFKWKTFEELADKESGSIRLTVEDEYEFIVYHNDTKIGKAQLITIGYDNQISYDTNIPNFTGNIRITAKKIK